MLRKISKIIGGTATHFINVATKIKGEVVAGIKEGYQQTKKQKCCWCNTMKQTTELKDIKSDKSHESYLLCPWCLEGITAIEAMWPNEKEKYLSRVIEEMLKEAKLNPDKKRGTGYNNFINEAGIIFKRIFPNETLKKDNK